MIFLDDHHAAGERLREIRAELEALEAEREELQRAPLSIGEIEAKLRADVERIATYAAGPLHEVEIRPGEYRPPPLTVTAEMLVALDPEGFIERAMAHMRQRAEQRGEVDPKKREKRLAAITKRQAELEEAEEREALALEDQGYYVCRREHVDVRLIERIWQESAG